MVAVSYTHLDVYKRQAVAISLEGRTLDESEERQVLDAITENSQLKVLCLMGRDEAVSYTHLEGLAKL